MMPSPERRKGNRFEIDTVEYLRAHGLPHAERAYGAGRPDDHADIVGVVGWALECKAHKAIDLAGFCAQAAEAATNTGARWWAVIIKRRNHHVKDAYVVMTLEQYARLVGDTYVLNIEPADGPPAA